MKTNGTYKRLKLQERLVTRGGGGGGGVYFPYILLNEIQTMFSQLSKRSVRFLPADLCTNDAHYVKTINQQS